MEERRTLPAALGPHWGEKRAVNEVRRGILSHSSGSSSATFGADPGMASPGTTPFQVQIWPRPARGGGEGGWHTPPSPNPARRGHLRGGGGTLRKPPPLPASFSGHFAKPPPGMLVKATLFYSTPEHSEGAPLLFLFGIVFRAF